MTTITFYEKPGCKGNLRQKTLLAAAGHTVQAKNLKAEAWTADRLLQFLGKLPVADWFNRHAPLIKSGAIDPEAFDAADATTVLSMLIDNPLLIRRPLLEVDGVCRAGFDVRMIHQWIGLSAAFGETALRGNPELCRDGMGGVRCPSASDSIAP